jgi:hypothetical protein
MSINNWMASAVKKPGSFTAEAKAHGMAVQEFANHVLANKSKFSTTTVRRANLAKTFKREANK